MTIRKAEKPPNTIVLSLIIESIAGKPPVIAASKQVDEMGKKIGGKQGTTKQSINKSSKVAPEKLLNDETNEAVNSSTGSSLKQRL